MCRGDDFVARANAFNHESDQQGVRARGDADGVCAGTVAILGQLFLAGLHLGPEDEVLRLHDLGDGLVNFGFDASILRLEIQQRNLHGGDQTESDSARQSPTETRGATTLPRPRPDTRMA